MADVLAVGFLIAVVVFFGGLAVVGVWQFTLLILAALDARWRK